MNQLLKRILAVFLAAILMLAAAGCAAKPEPVRQDASLPTDDTPAPEEPAAPEQTAENPSGEKAEAEDGDTDAEDGEEDPASAAQLPLIESLRPAEDYDEIYQLMLAVQESANSVFSMHEQDMPYEEQPLNPFAEQYGDPLYPDPASEGVLTGSLSVTDGEYIYMVSTGELIILKADGENTAELGRCFVTSPIPGGYGGSEDPQAVYVSGDSVLVVTYEYLYRNYETESGELGYDSTERVHVKRYDVSDPAAPVIMSDFAQSGRYLQSYFAADVLYLIGAHSIWMPEKEDTASFAPTILQNGEDSVLEPSAIILCPEPDSTDYTVVSAIDAQTGEALATKAVTGYHAWSEADQNALYLAGTSYRYEITEPYEEAQYTVRDYGYRAYTRLIRMELNGSLDITADAVVDGYLPDEDALSLHGDRLRLGTACSAYSFRVFTDEEYGFVNRIPGERVSSNALYALNTDLEIVNEMQELLPEQEIYKFRFDADRVWIMDYQDMFPDYTIDLAAEPWIAEPVEGGPSFAHNLYAVQNGMTVGTAVSEDGALMLACYDEQLNLLAETQVSDDWHQAMSRPDSVREFPALSVIAVPADNAYILYELEDGAFRLLGKAELGYTADTAIFYLDGFWYFCNDAAVTVLNEQLESVLKTEFAYG